VRKARVFISCGQLAEREKKIGLAVENYFKNERRFETYFAERVHSPDGLTENIFQHLRESEYFIFIDFKRNSIGIKKFRGSLFVNQEIAIASFLKLKGLGFVEKGIKREGILNYQIYNAFPFKNETEILQILKKETQDWDPDSVNELQLLFDPSNTTRNITLSNTPGNPLSDWYHIEVWNRNKIKHAFACSAYVSKIIDVGSGMVINTPTIELVWSGIGDIAINIMADGKRELDAFFVTHNNGLIHFNQRALSTSNPKYRLPDLPQGEYLITYTIISDNFLLASKEFRIIHRGSHAAINFQEEEEVAAPLENNEKTPRL
jgi:hypothetical protein